MVTSIKLPTLGFTLLEVVIYLALFTVLFSGLWEATALLQRSNEQAEYELLLQQNGNFVLDKMRSSLRDNATVTLIGTSTLSITPTYVEGVHMDFFVADDRWWIKRDDTSPDPITDVRLAVADMSMSIAYPYPGRFYLIVNFRLGGEPFQLTYLGYE
jgi:type II secretory pathway pseudopilin PulG